MVSQLVMSSAFKLKEFLNYPLEKIQQWDISRRKLLIFVTLFSFPAMILSSVE